MSLVVLCVGKRAEIPYCFSVAGIRIYSVEELCYFFRENAFLLDDNLANRQLVEWLETQCDLPELANLLYPLCKKGSDVETFVRTIVEYTGYFTGEEKGQVLVAVKECAGRTVDERKKNRADFYLESKKYELAIKEYELLLKECSVLPGENYTAFHGDIFFGMGIAFAKMFLFEQADYYLEKAYKILENEVVAFSMLAAKRMHLSEQNYICYIADHPELYHVSQALEDKLNVAEKMWQVSNTKKQLDDLKECKKLGEAQLYYEEMERITNRLKENFRKCIQE